MSKLNANLRTLVLNATNQVIIPKDERIPAFDVRDLKSRGILRKQYSPSFLGTEGEQVARDFAEALATKYPGQRFYVATVMAGVESASTRWVETGSVADEHVASESCDGDGEGNDLDDGTPNL